MADNIREWVADWYDDDYYSRSPSRNPQGPKSGDYRVVRDGALSLNLGDVPCAFSDVRCAFRDMGYPNLHVTYIGFRVVVDPGDL